MKKLDSDGGKEIEECKEKQVSDATKGNEDNEKNNEVLVISPDPKKLPIEKSPSPRLKYQALANGIDFTKLGSKPNFKEVSKRKFGNNYRTEKRVKRVAYVEFWDNELSKNVKFECTADKFIIENSEIAYDIAHNECDDDCATSKPLLKASVQYLISEVVKSIKSAPVERRTL